MWVKEGDSNSKFFYKVANVRHNMKDRKTLENKGGAILGKIDSISAEILQFFKKLYASPPLENLGG